MRKIDAKTENNDTPLFFYPNKRKEKDIEYSKMFLLEKVKDAGLSNLTLKEHSLRIGGSSIYANSGPKGTITAGFMGLWVSSTKW